MMKIIRVPFTLKWSSVTDGPQLGKVQEWRYTLQHAFFSAKPLHKVEVFFLFTVWSLLFQDISEMDQLLTTLEMYDEIMVQQLRALRSTYIFSSPNIVFFFRCLLAPWMIDVTLM